MVRKLHAAEFGLVAVVPWVVVGEEPGPVVAGVTGPAAVEEDDDESLLVVVMEAADVEVAPADDEPGTTAATSTGRALTRESA
jgi:hypothetical protein